MAYLVATVDGANAWGINPDRILVNVTASWVTADGVLHSASGDVPVAASALAAEVNATARQAAIDIAAAHGFAIGPSDVVRIFGGAVPNIS